MELIHAAYWNLILLNNLKNICAGQIILPFDHSKFSLHSNKILKYDKKETERIWLSRYCFDIQEPELN